MSPAQRRKRLLRLKIRKPRFGLFKFIALAVFILLLMLLLSFQTKYWDGRFKVSAVYPTGEGDISVSVFDPKNESITSILIPGSTELDVARQLGTWRAKSVWQLGINEDLGGKLLAESITKNFNFPIITWGNTNLMGLAEGEVLGIAKAIFLPGGTNLKIVDRVKMGIFAMGVTNPKRINIDLREGYLKKTRLTDGEEGYIILGTNFQKLYPIFSENEISQEGLRVQIKDATGKRGVAENVGETLEVLGLKIASVARKGREESDCKYRTSNEELGRRIGFIFSCEKEKGTPEGNFDLEVKLGSKFAERY